MELTDLQKSWIKILKDTEVQITELQKAGDYFYQEMLKALGEKADCHLCGNRHWPICKED